MLSNLLEPLSRPPCSKNFFCNEDVEIPANLTASSISRLGVAALSKWPNEKDYEYLHD